MIQADTAKMREQIITMKVGTVQEELCPFCIFMKYILMTDIVLLLLGIQLRSQCIKGSFGLVFHCGCCWWWFCFLI